MLHRYCWRLSSRLGCRGGYRRHPAISASSAITFPLRYDGGDNDRNENRNIHRSSQLRYNTSTSSSKPIDSNVPIGVLPHVLSPLNFKYMVEDQLRERFDAYDTNADGFIDAKEAIQLVTDVNHSNSNVVDPPNCAELKACAEGIIASMDTDDDRRVCWDEFKSAVDKAATPVSSRAYPISGAIFLNYAGQGVILPVMPFLALSVGMSTSQLGMVTASAAMARIVGNVPAALAAERFGRRPLLIAGPLLYATGMLGFGLAPTDAFAFPTMCAANTLCGFGSIMTVAGYTLYLTDISTPLNRARTMAPLMIATLMGFSIGPPIGGFVSDMYGLQMPFFVTSVALAGTSVAAMAFLPETLRQKNAATPTKNQDAPEKIAEETSTLGQWRTLLRKPDILGLSSASFVLGMAQGATAVTTIMYCIETLHMSPSELGIMFTACVVAMAAVTKPATDFSDNYVLNKSNCRSTLIIPGLGVVGLTMGLQGLEVFPSVLPFVTLLVVGAVANAALVSPNMTPLLIDVTTEEQRAQALAMRNMALDVGILTGALTLGALSQAVGVPESILCLGGVHILAALFFAATTHPGRQHKRALTALEEQGRDKQQ